MPVDLIDENGDCTTVFKETLEAIFERFDKDKDGKLDEEELKAYSKAANPDGREFDEDELGQIRDFFGMPLELEGWIEMYHTQTGAEEEA